MMQIRNSTKSYLFAPWIRLNNIRIHKTELIPYIVMNA